MNYHIGVDIGTGSVKAVAFDGTGEVVGRESVDYSMQHSTPDRSELDPDEVLEGVQASLGRLVNGLLPAMPVMVAFSAAMHSLLAVDNKGRPLTRCMIWADNRAGEIADELRQSDKGKTLYERTGVPIHAMTPLCKLLWLRENEPVIFTAAHKFIGIKEYIFYYLFGEFLVDTPIASATGLLNIHSLTWDEEALSFLGLDPSRLSRLVPPGYLMSFHDINKDASCLPLPLSSRIAIVIGSSDGALANLATGAVHNHAMAITIGTSGAARMLVKGPWTDELMRTFCYHARDNCYIIGGASNNGAVVIRWLKESLLQTDESYEELFALAATVPPGSDDLLFIPYILGERAPVWNSKARGVYFGLGIGHSKAHLIRAALEGVIYGLYSISKDIAGSETVTELHATGGFVRSPLWLQTLADVFNLKVLVFGEDESSALGAVMIGVEAMGKAPGFHRKVNAVFEPDISAHAIHLKRFTKYVHLYQLIKEEFES